MAIQTSAGLPGQPIDVGNVTQEGTLIGAVDIIFSDSATPTAVMAALEKAKAQIVAFYLKR